VHNPTAKRLVIDREKLAREREERGRKIGDGGYSLSFPLFSCSLFHTQQITVVARGIALDVINHAVGVVMLVGRLDGLELLVGVGDNH
jgi:hypothetical protein